MLSSGVKLPDCLRILADMRRLRAAICAVGEAVGARVRQGGRLSDAFGRNRRAAARLPCAR